jgi:hypothetical protein
MSSLGPQQQNLSFGDILQVPGGVTGQLQQVQDGSGNITGLWLSSVGSNVLNSIVEEQIFTATAGQTVFNLTTMTYEPATYMLQVYVNGLNKIVNVDYLETNATTVTFLSGLSAGQKVKFTTANGSVSTTVNASNITLVGANGVTGVVQDKIEELEQRIAALEA